jgi:hypothetical protein
MIDGEDLVLMRDRRFPWHSGFHNVEKRLFFMECLTPMLIPISDTPILHINGPHMISDPPDLSTFNGKGGGGVRKSGFPTAGPT